MEIITFSEASKIHYLGEKVYLIYDDGTKAIAESGIDMAIHFSNGGKFGKEDNAEFKITTNIELTDIQNTVAALEEKLNWLEDNYSYAVNEIREIEIALEVLNDLEIDVANID